MHQYFNKYINTILENDNGITIKVWDENDDEQDYDVLDQMEQIFNKVRINTRRDSIPGVYIMHHDKVVAGSYYMQTVKHDEDHDQDYIEATFDIAVDPEYQKYGMGNALIKENLALLESLSDGMPTQVKLWVINRKARDILEKFYDFDETSDFGDDEWYMEKWI